MNLIIDEGRCGLGGCGPVQQEVKCEKGWDLCCQLPPSLSGMLLLRVVSGPWSDGICPLMLRCSSSWPRPPHPDQVCSEWLTFPPVEMGWLDSLRSLSPFSSSVSFCVAPTTVTLQYNTKQSKLKLKFQ